ncbi:hypothetical protein DL763_000116 [Monosporascus cannonballus]|nr:hypothetical protein DL763_000116 [Monosporascus cannonballus]
MKSAVLYQVLAGGAALSAAKPCPKRVVVPFPEKFETATLEEAQAAAADDPGFQEYIANLTESGNIIPDDALDGTYYATPDAVHGGSQNTSFAIVHDKDSDSITLVIGHDGTTRNVTFGIPHGKTHHDTHNTTIRPIDDGSLYPTYPTYPTSPTQKGGHGSTQDGTPNETEDGSDGVDDAEDNVKDRNDNGATHSITLSTSEIQSSLEGKASSTISSSASETQSSVEEEASSTFASSTSQTLSSAESPMVTSSTSQTHSSSEASAITPASQTHSSSETLAITPSASQTHSSSRTSTISSSVSKTISSDATLPTNPPANGTENTVGCTNPEVLVEWRNMKTADKKSFVTAIRCLMDKPPTGLTGVAKSRYEELVWAHQTQASNIHMSSIFLPWHRYYTNVFHRLLREECGYTAPIPWWDETKDTGNFAASGLFTADYFGSMPEVTRTGMGTCITDGAFADKRLNIGPGFSNRDHCLSRGEDRSMTRHVSKAYVDTCVSRTAYDDMRTCVESGPHAYGHNGCGPVMADAVASPSDPLFFMHHTFVDHAWKSWQDKAAVRSTSISGCADRSRSCTPLTLATSLSSLGVEADVKVQDILDTEGGFLCYKYDY